MNFNNYHVPAEHQALRVKVLVFIERCLEYNPYTFKNPNEFVNDKIADAFIYYLKVIDANLSYDDEDALIELYKCDLTNRIYYQYGAFDGAQSILNNPEILAGLFKERPGLLSEVVRLHG